MIFRFFRIRYITFHIPVISYSVLSESVISISTFVLSDSVMSNLYYLFPLQGPPLNRELVNGSHLLIVQNLPMPKWTLM